MTFNVVLVGAGEINFGSPEGPWNHTLRLEALLGDELRVLSIIDPDVSRSKERVTFKQQGAPHSPAWSDTRCHATVQDAGKALAEKEVKLIVIGCPPHFRGTALAGKNLDLQLLHAFPQAAAYLVEKPIAAADPVLFDCEAVANAYDQSGAVVSVGYMFRYLKAIDKVKTILAREKLVPMCINARYVMAYEYARKTSWWNKDQSCGPVVEQATHFVDLMRHLAGSDVVNDSIHATTVEHSERAGRLHKLGFDESDAIPAHQRIPRTTVASWKHVNGTASSLCHAVSLHGTTYSTEIDVIADGWLFRLSGFYTDSPVLSIHSHGQSVPEILTSKDDPFTSEIDVLIKAVKYRREPSCAPGEAIQSSYRDALETYKLTWKIRRAGEGLH